MMRSLLLENNHDQNRYQDKSERRDERRSRANGKLGFGAGDAVRLRVDRHVPVAVELIHGRKAYLAIFTVKDSVESQHEGVAKDDQSRGGDESKCSGSAGAVTRDCIIRAREGDVEGP